MKISKKWLSLVGIVLFLVIILKIGLSDVVNVLKTADLTFILLAIIVVFFSIIVKGIKWNELIKAYKIKYPLRKSMVAWIVGFALGIVTPGRVGDLFRAVYLKKDENISLGKSLVTVIIDRVFDLVVLFILAFLGLFFLLKSFSIEFNIIFAIALAFICFLGGIYMLTKKKYVHYILRPIFRKFVPEKFKYKIKISFHDFYDNFIYFKKAKWPVLTCFLLTIVTWLFMLLEAYFLMLSLNISIDFSFFVLVLPVTFLLELVPVSIMGIGTRDAALIFFFSLISLSAATAVSFSFLLLFVNSLVAIVGAVFWFFSLRGEKVLF